MKTLKLREICDVKRGSSPRPKGDPKYFGGNIPRLTIRDVTRDGKYVSPKIDFLTEEGAKYGRFSPKGTLTMSISGTIGAVSFLNIDASVHDGFVLFDNINKIIDIDYLYYFLKNYNYNDLILDGGIFKNLTTDIIKDIEIKIPEIKIQKKIINKFLNEEKKIIKLKKLLEKIEIRNQYYADKLLSGELSIDEKGNIYNNKEIFRTLKLDEIFNFKMGQTILNKDITIEKHSEEEVPVFSATEKDKVFGYIHISKVKFPLNENDIIISARGTIGYPKINDIKIKTSTQTTIQMISKGTVSSYIVKKIMENKKEYYFASEGAAVPQLTISTLSNKTINIVENNLSVEVFLKKLDSEKSKVEKLLELEEKRFEWLSDKLLSGEYIIED